MSRDERGGYTVANRSERPGGRLEHLAGIGFLGLTIVFFFLASGCANIRVRMGTRPNTEVLESSLRLGESTRADVLAVLGMPDGKGSAMLPIDTQPRTLWSYYYGEGDLKDSRQIFLFVYFDQDRYDGYMWFSSLQK